MPEGTGPNGAVRARSHTAAFLMLALLSLIVYSRSFDNGFRQDDGVYIEHVEIATLLEDFKVNTDFAFYRPGAWMLFRVEHALFGRSAGAYIAFNFALHLATSILMFLLLIRLGLAPFAAAVASGLFLLGYGHYGKTVMWASCSGQIAAAAVSLTGMLVALRWAGCGGGMLLAAAVTILAAAGLFHEGACFAPAAAAIAVFECRRRRGLRSSPAAALLLFPLPLTLGLCSLLSAAYPSYRLGASLLPRAAVYLIKYAGFAVIPVQETQIVEVPSFTAGVIDFMPKAHLIAGSALLAILAYLAIFRRGYPRIFSLWFPLAILPFTLVLLPEGWLQLRYLYYASIPLCGLAGAGFTRAASSRRPLIRAAASILFILLVLCTSSLIMLLEAHYAGF